MQVRPITPPFIAILLAFVAIPYISLAQSTSKSSMAVTSLKQRSVCPINAAETYTTEQEDQDKRKLAFAWRELQLFVEEKNWNIEVENDGLDNQIAELQGGSSDPWKRIRAMRSARKMQLIFSPHLQISGLSPKMYTSRTNPVTLKAVLMKR